MNECSKCHKTRKLHGTGRCNPCQVMWHYKNAPPQQCDRCQQMRLIFSRKLCKSCYQVVRRFPDATLRGTPEYSAKMRTITKAHAQRREASPKWKGGRFVDPNGYVRLLAPDGYEGKRTHSGRYVAEHRYVAETKILKRLLLPNEIVHHMNHQKTDNRPENLRVFKSVSEHRCWHVAHPLPIAS